MMVRNPQANAIIERIHQVTANMVRTFELEDTCMDEDDPWAGTLAAVVFAACSMHQSDWRTRAGRQQADRSGSST